MFNVLFKQTPEPVKAAQYEEELEKIKLDLATISTTYLLTKNMRSKWRSEAHEVEEAVEGQENAEEETETVEEELKEENDEPDVNDQGKEEGTVIDIEQTKLLLPIVLTTKAFVGLQLNERVWMQDECIETKISTLEI